MGKTQGRSMRQTNGAFSFKGRPCALIAAAFVAGCTSGTQLPTVEQAVQAITFEQPTNVARHIEIELDDPASGLPCSVVDRPDRGTRTILWRAENELGFCQNKAEETLAVLKRRGWACRPESSGERRTRSALQGADGSTRPSHVVAAWRCLEGLNPVIEQAVSYRPPGPDAAHIPEARPEHQNVPGSGEVGDRVLLSAVQRDLSVIGQDVIDDGTIIDSAQGDLNEDGSDDAVVVVTRDSAGASAHRLLMAYLRSGEAYQLVDVWVLKTPDTPADGPLSLAIEDGKVRLDDCCGEAAEPTVLVLDDRKLAHANGG